jgi:hypothetical protein
VRTDAVARDLGAADQGELGRRASHPAETPDDEDRLAGVRPGRVQPPEISVDVE